MDDPLTHWLRPGDPYELNFKPTNNTLNLQEIIAIINIYSLIEQSSDVVICDCYIREYYKPDLTQ